MIAVLTPESQLELQSRRQAEGGEDSLSVIQTSLSPVYRTLFKMWSLKVSVSITLAL